MKPQAFIRDLRIRRNDLHVGMDQIWPVVNVLRIALPHHENDHRRIRIRMIRQVIAPIILNQSALTQRIEVGV